MLLSNRFIHVFRNHLIICYTEQFFVLMRQTELGLVIFDMNCMFYDCIFLLWLYIETRQNTEINGQKYADITPIVWFFPLHFPHSWKHVTV